MTSVKRDERFYNIFEVIYLFSLLIRLFGGSWRLQWWWHRR